jgi:hypothetical protein
MNVAQPSYQLILENKPVNPCIVHARELLIDLQNQANINPGGPWVRTVPTDNMLKFVCKLCGCTRTYKLMTEKTLL